MSRGRPCFVTAEWAPQTAGGIGRAVRNLAECCTDGAVVLLDQPPRAVRAARKKKRQPEVRGAIIRTFFCHQHCSNTQIYHNIVKFLTKAGVAPISADMWPMIANVSLWTPLMQ